MSSAVITGLVALVLFSLTALALTMQSIEKKRKEQCRLEAALKTRARNFQYMLDSFPQGFLTSELQQLVCQCLIDVYGQLIKLATTNQEYPTRLDQTKQLLGQLKSQESKNSTITLSDPAQIKEVQKLLSSLYSFIGKLQKSRRINENQAKVYALQVRRLIVQGSVDGLNQASLQAMQSNKARLAIHHLVTAIDKMNKENSDGFFNQRITLLNEKVLSMESQAQESEDNELERTKQSAEEWDELSKPKESWKKKALYN